VIRAVGITSFAPVLPLRAAQQREVCYLFFLSVWWEISTSSQDGCGLTLGNLTNLNRYISFDINMAFLVGPANSDVQFRDSSSWQYENGIFIWAGISSLDVLEMQWALTEKQEAGVCLIFPVYEQYVRVPKPILDDSYLFNSFWHLQIWILTKLHYWKS